MRVKKILPLTLHLFYPTNLEIHFPRGRSKRNYEITIENDQFQQSIGKKFYANEIIHTHSLIDKILHMPFGRKMDLMQILLNAIAFVPVYIIFSQ